MIKKPFSHKNSFYKQKLLLFTDNSISSADSPKENKDKSNLNAMESGNDYLKIKRDIQKRNFISISKLCLKTFTGLRKFNLDNNKKHLSVDLFNRKNINKEIYNINKSNKSKIKFLSLFNNGYNTIDLAEQSENRQEICDSNQKISSYFGYQENLEKYLNKTCRQGFKKLSSLIDTDESKKMFQTQRNKRNSIFKKKEQKQKSEKKILINKFAFNDSCKDEIFLNKRTITKNENLKEQMKLNYGKVYNERENKFKKNTDIVKNIVNINKNIKFLKTCINTIYPKIMLYVNKESETEVHKSNRLKMIYKQKLLNNYPDFSKNILLKIPNCKLLKYAEKMRNSKKISISGEKNNKRILNQIIFH